MSGIRRKHVPLRSCIACQKKRPKRELVRIVRTPEGAFEVDPRGKRAGRGTYFCPTHQCMQEALEQSKLQRVLECQISAEEVMVLRAEAAQLLE